MQPTIDTSHRSPNFNDRPPGAVINALVIHTTEGPWDSDIRWLCNPASQVSTGYVISPTGTTYRLVDDAKRAWHAGVSSYLGRRDWNDFSIGIEIAHQQGHPYGPQQRPALTGLCRSLIARYPINRQYVVTHRQIAQPFGRKVDPTDWADADFKLWADGLFKTDPLPPTADPLRLCVLPGPNGLTFRCGTGFYDLYKGHGGFAFFGYALSDETRGTGQDGRPCTWMRFERAVLKYVAGEGVKLALLSEAKAQGWLS